MDSRMRYRSHHNDHLLGHSLHNHHQHHNNNNNGIRVGQLYTMCGSNQQQASGAQLLMNAPNVATATQFQFIPGRRNFMTSAPLRSQTSATTNDTDLTMSSGLFTVMPFINSIKGFFTNLMRPKGSTEPCSLDNTHREFNSVPNIYMNLMSKNSTSTKCDLPHSNDIDFDLFDAHTLSASTKSFSDIDLRITAAKDRREIMVDAAPAVPKITIPQQQTSIDIPATATHIAKEIQTDRMGQKTSLQSSQPTIKLAGRRHKRNKRINKHRKQSAAAIAMERMSQSPQPSASTVFPSTAKCTLINSHQKKPAKMPTKNKKEKIRHELAWNIHEDIEDDERCVPDEDTVDFARIENIPSAQPASQCIISAAFTCFTAKDFPAIRSPTKSSPVITIQKKASPRPLPTTPPPSPTPAKTTKSSCSWEIPIRSPHSMGAATAARSAALRSRLADASHRHRQISECDTEDNFIVFSNSVNIENEIILASSLESTLSFCDQVRNHFAENGRRRSRHFSDSSDDFICFELEDDEDEDDVDGDDDDDTTSEEESDSEDDTLEEELIYANSDADGDDDDVKSVETNQLDSGFEEKKVSILVTLI